MRSDSVNRIRRKIYFDILTGQVIVDTGERQFSVVETTVEQDIMTFTGLSERNRNTFDILELEYGQYAQDFAECIGYQVNPETKELEFSYPDPNAPEEPQPYQAPLSEEVKTLKNELATVQGAVDFIIMNY